MKLKISIADGPLIFEMSELEILRALSYSGAGPVAGIFLRPGTRLTVEASHEHSKYRMTICEAVTVPELED